MGEHETNPWNDVRSYSDTSAEAAPAVGEHPESAPEPALGTPEEAPADTASAPEEPGPRDGSPVPPAAETPGPHDAIEPYGAPRQTSGPAVIAALVCGICAIVLSAVPILGLALGIAAIVLAARAKRGGAAGGVLVAGRICGIVGTVFAAFFLVIYALAAGAAIQLLSDDALPGALSERADTDRYDPDDPYAFMDDYESSANDEQRAAWAAVEEKLFDIYLSDDIYVDYLVNELEEAFLDDEGTTPEDLGIDAREFAYWVLEEFDYEANGTFVKDGRGTAYVTVYQRDPFELLYTWSDLVEEAADDPANRNLDYEGAVELTERLFHEAMDEAADPVKVELMLTVVEKDGEWTVDEDSWDDAVYLMFGLN